MAKETSRAGDGGARAQEFEEGPGAALRRLFAELYGTFALTMVAAGGEVVAAVSHGQVSQAARVIAPGLLVMAMIYALGDVSGAHFNPVVSLAFAARRDFPWGRLPGYWAAQFAGAVLAALLLRAVFGPTAHVGATLPHYDTAAALVMEVVLSCFLLSVILCTATRNKVIGPNAALAVGGTIALCGLFAGPISGASMNPARSLGPALVSGATKAAWIYVVGPFAGGALAVLFTWLLHSRQDPSEAEAASGEG